ncbi:MAG TPA: ABC transporter transmembrane domain-containing protein [Aestuariivirga sp.]|nr:ABC transporter transmembrane domain-containing protein [Aestuariivirga sp.]
MAENTQQEPGRKSLKPLARLTPFLTRYKPQIAKALIALAIASGSTLVVPIAVRRIIDHGFTTSNAVLVNQYFSVMIAVVLLLALSSAIRFYYVMWLGEKIVADVRDALFTHLLKLSPGFYETQKTGEVVSRLTADTTQIKSAFSSTASIALRNGVMLVGAIVMMIVTSPKLAGLAGLAIPLIVLPLVTYGRRVRALSRAAQDTLAASAAFAQERLSAITTVQSNVQEVFTDSEFAKATHFAFSAAAKRALARAFLTGAIIFVALGSIVGLLWFGAQEVISGNLSGGTLSQFVIYAVIAASSLGQLSEVWGEIQLAAGAAERISELLDEKPVITTPPNPVAFPDTPKGQVKFSGVTFHYPTRLKTTAINNVSFIARPGEVTAIVGPSGAGKSTLFALIQRFYDPASGTITIDGLDIKSVDPQELRKHIAVVPQDTIIFSGSVLDNIRFGAPEATREAAMAAAIAARVDEFAKKLPKGFDTEVGERGVTLSGGQRQRIAIARAILRDAPILLLDEATSALDAESESLIQDALEKLTANRTTLVVAHRLATVRNADRILVFDNGKLVAQGTHSQLVKKNALYARLAKLQFSAPST